MDEQLTKAIEYFNAGKKGQAARLFNQVIINDPRSSTAWWGLALCQSDPAQMKYCLQNVLNIDPMNKKARQLLDEIQSRSTPSEANRFGEDTQFSSSNPTQPSHTAPAVSRSPSAAVLPLATTASISNATRIKKYKIKWWLILLPILAVIIAYQADTYSDFYDRLDEWQAKKYGNVLKHNFKNGSEFMKRLRAFESSREYALIRTVTNGMYIVAAAMAGFWLLRGVHGGIVLAHKKLRGGGWLIALLLMPVILIPGYLALMSVMGEFAFAWGKHASYSNKKCPHCQSWIPIKASRCKHCSQIVPLDESI